MTKEEKFHYGALFVATSKSDPAFISWAETVEHCTSFQVPATVAVEILRRVDSDHDWKWDVDEYSSALHDIETPVPPPTAEQKAYCQSMFAKLTKRDSLRMTPDEVMQVLWSTRSRD
jgi:hypothetical protein